MEAVIPSVSIDGLLAARDAMQEAVAQSRVLLRDAAARLAEFGIEGLRVQAEFARGEHRSITDGEYADAIRREIDRHVWLAVLRATNVDTLMDSETRRDMEEKLHTSPLAPSSRRSDLPELTKENLIATWEAMVGRAEDFFERGVEAVYRSLSWDHKTNTPGLIGETLIVRGAFYWWTRNLQGESAALRHHEPLNDLERVLCLLDKRPPPTHQTGLRGMKEALFGVWTPVPCAGGDGTALMSVKLHRKGTAHVRILRPDLLQALNAIMARRYPGQIGTGSRRKCGGAA